MKGGRQGGREGESQGATDPGRFVRKGQTEGERKGRMEGELEVGWVGGAERLASGGDWQVDEWAGRLARRRGKGGKETDPNKSMVGIEWRGEPPAPPDPRIRARPLKRGALALTSMAYIRQRAANPPTQRPPSPHTRKCQACFILALGVRSAEALPTALGLYWEHSSAHRSLVRPRCNQPGLNPTPTHPPHARMIFFAPSPSAPSV